MKDLNRESNGESWPSCFGESNLSNGQFYYAYHPSPRTVSDSHLGYDKDIVKQTMVEHEAIFKNQVYELHRLYRVQRDLMDVRRKEQCKRRIPYETSSSSSAVPSQMQYEDVQRWNGQNLPLTNSVYGRVPISVPETVQSSPNSGKGKSIQAGPSGPSPKNSESESRPTKLRRRMLDLQLPAEEYIDTDEVEQFNDVKNSDFTSPSPDKKGKFLRVQGDGSRSDLNGSPPKALADLNEPLIVDEVDFCHGSQCDSMYRDFSTRLVNTFKDVPHKPKNSTLINGISNNVHFENRTNGANWFCNALESENKGSTRSFNKAISLDKTPIPSQPGHILLDQAIKPPAFLTIDHIKEDPSKPKSVINLEKSERVSYSMSNYNVPGSIASHLSNQPGYFHSGSVLGQKAMSIQTSPYLTPAHVNKNPQSSTQSNDMFCRSKWNLNNIPSALGNETPVRNGLYEGSPSNFRGFDYVNRNYNDKKAANCVDLNPLKGMNLNEALPNGLSDDDISHQGVKIVNKDHKPENSLAVFPWLRGKTTCNNEVDNSRKDLNSIEPNSLEVDVKAKISGSTRKILGVPIFENPITPKKEVSKPTIIDCDSGVNNESESGSGRKLIFDINASPCDPTEEEDVILEDKTENESASIRHHFDLNLCVNDDEIPCETAVSGPENGASIRVDTDIDLEAPIIIEDEEVIVISPDEDSLIQEPEKEPVLPKDNGDNEKEFELARSAASVIVSLSSLAKANQSEEATTCVRVQTDSDDTNPLRWFVEIACSNNGNNLENGNDLLPEGIDDFEMMTLRQKECNEEEYFPKPSFPVVPDSEERGTCVLTTARTRKGHARRGRQRRDFQRDILPGLTSLSRNEVTEDLQVFGGLMRATGHPWQAGPNRKNTTRNGCGRGRRQSVGTTAVVGQGPGPSTSPALAPVAALCALPVKQKNVESKNIEVGVEDRSLTGWGKTTRRPRRQRCPPGQPAPPVPLT